MAVPLNVPYSPTCRAGAERKPCSFDDLLTVALIHLAGRSSP